MVVWKHEAVNYAYIETWTSVCFFIFLTSHQLQASQEGSHIKWPYVLATCLNMNCYQTKTREFLTKKTDKIFHKKQGICDNIFAFHFYFLHLC